MKASDLATVWGAPDNSRVTAKQYSFRLPVHVAAKLAALEELYPTRSRTQLVGDLLSAAIADIETTLPSRAGRFVLKDQDTGEDMFEEEGPSATFKKLANKHYQAIESELGNNKPGLVYPGPYFVTADGK